MNTRGLLVGFMGVWYRGLRGWLPRGASVCGVAGVVRDYWVLESDGAEGETCEVAVGKLKLLEAMKPRS